MQSLKAPRTSHSQIYIQAVATTHTHVPDTSVFFETAYVQRNNCLSNGTTGSNPFFASYYFLEK